MSETPKIPSELSHLKEYIENIPTKYQLGYIRTLSGKMPRSKALALKCLDCCGWQRKQPGPGGESLDLIKDCPVKTCPLWVFRPGGSIKRRKAPKVAQKPN